MPDGTGRPLSVCVLERGREYLPGMFPSRLADVPAHLRATLGRSAQPMGDREGLFDLRVGEDVNVLVANGLGGGSLINAGVMARPTASVLADPAWPRPLRAGGLQPFYEEIERLLGARDDAGPNTFERVPAGPPAKTFALRRLAPAHYRAAPVTVALADGASAAGVPLRGCIGCGDCASGCNHQAKESLDTNLLVEARRRGARLYTGATVLRLEREGASGLWALSVVHTARPLRERDRGPTRITAGRVILVASTFGSTEILLRSQSDSLRFSARLGQRFSSNGDMIAVAYDQALPANATADECDPPAARRIGPTITGIVDLREQSGRDGQPIGLVIEDLAIPAGLRRLFEESTALSLTLHRMKERDADDHVADSPGLDPCAVDRPAMQRTLPVAIIGRDEAAGAIELVRGPGEPDDDNCSDGDGAVVVRWPRLREEPLFARQIATLQDLVTRSATGGRVLPNPMWRLLPEGLNFLVGGQLGPPFTVHPLGGCAMADDAASGVVDELGQVFDAGRVDPGGAPPVLPGLVVLDGSVIPVSLGINPALTIAAVSLRAVRRLRDEVWGLMPAVGAPVPVDPRPVHQVPEPPPRVPTVVRNLERMSGPVVLEGADGTRIRCQVELTLPFEPAALDALMGPLHRELRVDERAQGTRAARLRLFRRSDWKAIVHPRPMARRGGPPSRKPVEQQLDDAALLIAPLAGSLRFLHREPSTARERMFRAWIAWAGNRGLRDTLQWVLERRQAHAPDAPPSGETDVGNGEGDGDGDENRDEDGDGGGLLAEARKRLTSSLDLASRAGEVRRFDYSLTIGAPLKDVTAGLLGEGLFAALTGTGRPAIEGNKRLTYGWLCNPWEQMSTLELTAFPLLRQSRERPLLTLDLKFLARQQVPILQVESRHDEVSLIVDLASFALYLLRVLISLHAWSFRKPDAPEPREPQRLPGWLRKANWPGRLVPRITELELDRLADGTPVRVRLTRYPRLDSTRPPVVMIHGYSASGTTFAHPSVSPNLASYLHARGRDVWVLDLRTSSGMATARVPWKYEEAALQDIPAAIDRIVDQVGGERGDRQLQVDVVAHCMGAAMFSMALLAAPRAGERFFVERERLPQRIRRVVLSQVGPLMVFSPMNIFRAYLMRWMLQLLPMADYAFRPRDDAGIGEQLLDRLLATMPYPPVERRIENPLRFWRTTPFVGTRHRMDALYGRSFSLANLNRRTLAAIDDLFGPLSIATVAQTIHFAQRQLVTNHAGRNVFVSRETLHARWGGIATLSLHGLDNGLSDPATLARMQAIVGNDARLDFEFEELAGFGHQDSLIGRDSMRAFTRIEAFLQDPRPLPAVGDRSDGDRGWLAQVPWIGPVVGPLQVDGADGARLTISASANPAFGRAQCAAVLAVCRNGDRWRLARGDALELIALPPDVDGWLNLEVRIEGWPAPTEGLLVVLLYDQPAELDQPTTAIDERGSRTDADQDNDGGGGGEGPRGAGHAGGADDPAGAAAGADRFGPPMAAASSQPSGAAQPPAPPPRVRRAAPSERRIDPEGAAQRAMAAAAGDEHFAPAIATAGVPANAPAVANVPAAGDAPVTINAFTPPEPAPVDPRIGGALDRLLDESSADDLLDGFIELAPRRRAPFGPVTRVAFGSCQYPAGMLVESIAHASYDRLRAAVERGAAEPVEPAGPAGSVGPAGSAEAAVPAIRSTPMLPPACSIRPMPTRATSSRTSVCSGYRRCAGCCAGCRPS
ncbi:MAG TPA: GMC family oxidoreductase N-terminal domain-containing protein [Burkholderiaceae bacterium]|nr:GMC family oxidoreductase N-terminal domain-containing protein [Burkholderiaceae bacterium]